MAARLDAEAAIVRMTTLARDRAATLPLSVGSTDGQLEGAIQLVLGELKEDRRLGPLFRRPRRDLTSIHDLAAGIATWEVIRAAVGDRFAEARYAVLRGSPPGLRPETEAILRAVTEGGGEQQIPGAVRQSPRRVARRRRRLDPPATDDPAVLAGLLEAVTVQPTDDDDPCHDLGYDHSVWLEEWLELAVGTAAVAGLETAVAAHRDVLAALHEDRETLFVAAPRLHPDDVRTIIVATLAPHFDPGWDAEA